MNWERYAAEWSALHGGFTPTSPVVRGWIRIAWRAGVLLGRLGVGPTAVTLTGLLLCWLTPVAATAGRVGVFGAAVLVLAASFADAFDGAVAVVTGRASRAGFVVDSVADRLGEAAWLVALWVVGAPAWVAVAAGAVSWLHEYVRARATAAGMAEIGAVTVGERPTRVSMALSGMLVAAVFWPWAGAVVTGAAAAWLALGLVGIGQLAFAVRRALR